jgi:hypothetical protein
LFAVGHINLLGHDASVMSAQATAVALSDLGRFLTVQIGETDRCTLVQ